MALAFVEHCSGTRFHFTISQPGEWEPVEFPPYSSGSARPQALQENVDKMLHKWTLELVHRQSLGFYNWLFLVQKAMRGW